MYPDQSQQVAYNTSVPDPKHYYQDHYPYLAIPTRQNYRQVVRYDDFNRVSLSKNTPQSALSYHHSTMPAMFDDSYRVCLSEDTNQSNLY